MKLVTINNNSFCLQWFVRRDVQQQQQQVYLSCAAHSRAAPPPHRTTTCAERRYRTTHERITLHYRIQIQFIIIVLLLDQVL